MSNGKVEKLAIDRIRIDGDTQPRLEVLPDIVEDYRDDMLRGDEFPPVEVVFDGTCYWLFDGFHRFKAARLARLETLAAIVHEGTKEEAIWRSLAANAAHGLRRSNQDKQWAICRAIKMRPDWSNRFISRHVGVNHRTVGRQRVALESTGEVIHLHRRRGIDGRWHPTTRSPRETWLSSGEILQFGPARPRRGRHGRFVRSYKSPRYGLDMMGHRLNETPRPRLLCEVFDRREDVARMIKMVTRVQEDAMMMFDHRDPLLSGFDWTRFDAAMAEALRHLEGICPHAVCPLCKGAGCPTCGDRGWVNRELYDQATDTPRGLPEPAAVV